MPRVQHLADVCGTWIFGESGAGKTRAALSAFPDAFIKPRNKWWDGYQYEDVVIVDDVDKFNVSLGGDFKDWADFSAFIGEFKGGSRRIRPKQIIVTSQYMIEDIWTDPETREALNRRFKVVTKELNKELLLI